MEHLPAKSFDEEISDDLFLTNKADCMSVVDCFCLKTRNTIPFGWPIKRSRRITLFLLFLSGGALSALLSEGVGVTALIKLLSLLLSLLSSESAQQMLLLLELLLAFYFRFFVI